MTHIVLSPPPRRAHATLVGRLVVTVLAAWRRSVKEYRVRATIGRLHRLNDRTLRDIGLERDSIEPVVRSRCLDC